MAKITYLRRQRKHRRRLLTPPIVMSGNGTSIGRSTVKGFFGMTGTSQGTATVIAFANGGVGTITTPTPQVLGVMNVSASVGTADATIGGFYPLVLGVTNVAAAVGTSVCQSTAIGSFGAKGTAFGTSTIVTAFATTLVEAIDQQSDLENRLASLLPPSWFETTNGTIVSIPIAGMAYGLQSIYNLYLYVIEQTRLATSTGVWLDRLAYDFLGINLPRLLNEGDDDYRARIKNAILAQKQTRDGISTSLESLTGQEPEIIELWNPGDVGNYGLTTVANDGVAGIATQGYGVAGMYGSLNFRNQILINAFRPSGGGIPAVPGYGIVSWGYTSLSSTNPNNEGGGEYCDLSQMSAQVLDTDIYNNIAGTVAAGVTAWTAILVKPDTVDAPTAYYGDINNSSYAALFGGSGYFF